MPETPELLKDGDKAARTAELAVGIIVAAAALAFIGWDVSATWKKDGNFWSGYGRLVIGIEALGTLAILSILYRENPISRFFEHILIGASVGYGVGVTWTDVFYPKFIGPLSGLDGQPVNLWWLLCLIPGVMWYFQLSKKRHWISKLIICTFMGIYCGAAFRGVANTLLGDRGLLTQSIAPLFSVFADTFTGAGLWKDIRSLLTLIISLTVLSYFFFSFSHEKNPLLRSSSKLGRYFLMVCFGAVFGTTVQGRMSLLIDRLTFLFNDWLKF